MDHGLEYEQDSRCLHQHSAHYQILVVALVVDVILTRRSATEDSG